MSKTIKIAAAAALLFFLLALGWIKSYRYYTDKASSKNGDLAFYRLHTITGKIEFQYRGSKGKWLPLAELVYPDDNK